MRVPNLFLLAVLFIPTQLGRHFWPQFAYIYSLKIDYLSPVLYLWDIVVIILGVSLIRSVNKTALCLLLLFILTQALSLIRADNVGAGLVRLEQLFVAGLFGVYIASRVFSSLKKDLINGLMIGVIFESILGFSQFITGSSIGFWILGERTFDLSTNSIATFNWFGQTLLRPYGTFPHPNVLSAYLLISLVIITYFRKSITYWLIGAVAITLTFSRIAFVVLAAETAIFFKKRLKMLTILIVLFLPLVFTRFESALNFDSLSILRRTDLNLVAIRLFLTEPIFGVGLNNFINSVALSELVAGPSRFLQPVHNIILLQLVEAGLIGLLGFCLLFIPVIRSWKDPLVKNLAITFFILGMFDHYFLSLPQGQRIMFLIWGLSFRNRKNTGN